MREKFQEFVVAFKMNKTKSLSTVSYVAVSTLCLLGRFLYVRENVPLVFTHAFSQVAFQHCGLGLSSRLNSKTGIGKRSIKSVVSHSSLDTQIFLKRGGKGDSNDDFYDEDDDRDYRDALALNRARTDIRNFLTQRAIQSFQFLLTSCRDEATVRWLENMYGFKNLDNFHGTGAFNLTLYPKWDSILSDMLQRPKDVVIVSAKRRGAGHGGWSKKNPYLEERWVEFEIDIDPPSLVSRIVSVREQIAREWTKDLNTLMNINEMILQAYTQQQASERKSEQKDDSAKRQNQSTTSTSLNRAGKDDEKVDSYSHTERPQTKDQQKRAYDRSQMQYLGNTIGFDDHGSSAYRKGSFDLLALLATQESVHRVLREYRDAGETREVSYIWLREFYISRVGKFFDGNQNYGRADDFLEELLLTSPSMKEIENGKKVGLIDPLRVAEDIIETRSEVYMDWKAITEVVPASDHMDLRRTILDIQMGKTLDATIFGSTPYQPDKVTATTTASISSKATQSMMTPPDSTILFDDFEHFQ